MKRLLIATAVLFVLVMLRLVFVADQSDERWDYPPELADIPEVAQSADEPPAQPDTMPEPEETSPPVTESITQEPAPQSCAEAERSGIIFAGDVEPDEDHCARALRMVLGPRVLILPDFYGFDTRDMGDRSPRARLFEESDRPEWSRVMEGRILSVSAELVEFPLMMVQATCRSSICGVIIVYRSADFPGGSYNHYAQELADALGFRGYHAGQGRRPDGIGFMYAYLGDWATPRLE